MINLTYYVIQKWDGGSNHYDTDIAFESEYEADRFLKDNRYDSYREHNVVIYKNINEYYDGESERKKQKALKKLTEEERKILGLE